MVPDNAALAENEDKLGRILELILGDTEGMKNT